MAGLTLTSANAILMLSVPGVFSQPQQLQGFAADDIFGVDEVKRIETLMGVDGVLSGGKVFNKKIMHIVLQSDSESNAIFAEWDAAETFNGGDVLLATMTVTLTAIQTKFSLTRGFFSDGPPGGLPDLKKIIQPRKYTIEWGQVIPQAS